MNKPVTTCGTVVAVILAIGFSVAVQAQRGAPPRPPAAPASPAKPGYSGPRTPDRKPDLNGIWQVMNTAHWNVEAHSASEGIPAGFSVVEGGSIPYQPAALAKRNENFKNRLMADPIRKCYMLENSEFPVALSWMRLSGNGIQLFRRRKGVADWRKN